MLKLKLYKVAAEVAGTLTGGSIYYRGKLKLEKPGVVVGFSPVYYDTATHHFVSAGNNQAQTIMVYNSYLTNTIPVVFPDSIGNTLVADVSDYQISPAIYDIGAASGGTSYIDHFLVHILHND